LTATGLAFGPDGNLYVASQSNNSVIRYDGSTGSFIDAFVPSGSGGLTTTEAVLFGPDGNLYVTEFAGNRILRYDGVTGAFLGVFASDPSLVWARSMVFGPDGNLYVAGNQSNNVVRFNGTTGAFIDVFAIGISGANGLLFGPDGNLYVAAEIASRVMRFDGSTGAFIDNFASVIGPVGMMFDVRTINTVAGGGDPSPSFCGDGGPAASACLFYPIGIGVDATGNVYIADDFNHRLRMVDAATGTISTVAGGGDPTPFLRRRWTGYRRLFESARSSVSSPSSQLQNSVKNNFCAEPAVGGKPESFTPQMLVDLQKNTKITSGHERTQQPRRS